MQDVRAPPSLKPMKGFTLKTEGPGEFVNGELITQGIDEST